MTVAPPSETKTFKNKRKQTVQNSANGTHDCRQTAKFISYSSKPNVKTLQLALKIIDISPWI
uniref:Uncharacterized protein n=1 Tax=Manihot esculenta TaxID=3983 RepID=A0A2C9UMR6_MANES